MHYKITHTTTYNYSEPVRVCHNYVMLTPREDLHVRCQSHRLVIRPTPLLSGRRKDYFGNTVHSFSIEENHRQLTVTATSRVAVDEIPRPDPEASTPWEQIAEGTARQTDAHWWEACPFVFDSPRVQRDPRYRDFAEESFSAGRPIVAAAQDLVRRIHAGFQYDPQATSVTTSTEEAFQLRRGVCQDFAHIAIACLRSLGLPARYVSGYLRTIPPPGEPRRVGVDQSHAWVSLYTGPELQWMDFDPTNNAPCSTDHVPVAWGRDYSDVVPMKGVVLGGGEHQLHVSVDVAPVEES
jgi:transglutaminase-like putative cysteine protease